MHAGCPLTPSVMTWDIFSCSAIFDKTERQQRLIFQTNIKIFHKLLYYLSFVCLNPNKLQYTLRGCLIQLCIYSFEAKLFAFTEEYGISIIDPQDGTISDQALSADSCKVSIYVKVAEDS